MIKVTTFIDCRKLLFFCCLLFPHLSHASEKQVIRLTAKDCKQQSLCADFMSELAASLYRHAHLLTDEAIEQRFQQRSIESYLGYDDPKGSRYSLIETEIAIQVIEDRKEKFRLEVTFKNRVSKKKFVFKRSGLNRRAFYWYRNEFLSFVRSNGIKRIRAWRPAPAPEEFQGEYSIPRMMNPVLQEVLISFNDQASFPESDNRDLAAVRLDFEDAQKRYSKEDYERNPRKIKDQFENIKTRLLRIENLDPELKKAAIDATQEQIQLTHEFILVNQLNKALKKNYIDKSELELFNYFKKNQSALIKAERFQKLQSSVSKTYFIHMYNVETDELNHGIRYAEKYYINGSYRMARSEYEKLLGKFLEKQNNVRKDEDLFEFYKEFTSDIEVRIDRIKDVQNALLLARIYPYIDLTEYLFLTKRLESEREEEHIDRALYAYRDGLEVIRTQLNFQELNISSRLKKSIEKPLKYAALEDGVRDLMYDCLGYGEKQNYTVYRCSSRGRNRRVVPEGSTLASYLDQSSVSFSMGYGYRANDTPLIESRGKYLSFRLAYQIGLKSDLIFDLVSGLDHLLALRFGDEELPGRTQFAIPMAVQVAYPVIPELHLFTGVEGYWTLPMSINGQSDPRSQRYDLYIQMGAFYSTAFSSELDLEFKLEYSSNLTPGDDGFVPIFSYPSYRFHLYSGVRYHFGI